MHHYFEPDRSPTICLVGRISGYVMLVLIYVVVFFFFFDVLESDDLPVCGIGSLKFHSYIMIHV